MATITATKPEQIHHKISLMSKDQAAQLIKPLCLNIKRRFRLGGILFKNPKINYTIIVTYHTDPKLIVSKMQPLLFIKYGENKGTSVSVSEESNKIDFDLFLDPNQVLDCEDAETEVSSSYKVPYDVKVLNGTDVVTSVSGEIEIEIERIVTSAPVFRFEPNDRGRSLTYSNSETKPFEIGSIVIRNAGNLLRTPACSIEMELEAKVKDGTQERSVRGLVFMGEDVVESNPRVYVGGDDSVVVPLGYSGSDFIRKISLNKAKLQYIHVNKPGKRSQENNNTISIPVFWDMSKVQNPLEDIETYILHVNASYDFQNDPLSKSQSFYNNMTVDLHKNTKMMDLGVGLYDAKGKENIYSDIVPSVRVPMMISGVVTTFGIELKNTAEATEIGKENARIYVKDFIAKLPTSGPEFSQVKGKVQDNLFELTDNSTLKGDGEKFSLPVKGSQKFEFVYDHTCIDKIMDGTVEVFEKIMSIPVSFKYYLDKEDEYSSHEEIPEGKYVSFKNKIKVKCQKEPKPDWLCLDFGTSAVVASYGSNFYDEKGMPVSRLLPLKEHKQNNLRAWYKGNKTAINDVSESDPNLINSSVVVNITKTSLTQSDILSGIDNVQNYNDSTLMFSPSSSVFDIYSRMLPSLKTLMGNKTLPMELLPQNVSGGEDNEAVSVDKLFELVYRQMFQHFLPDNVKGTNKAVFTVPNTYAPAHVKTLRKLAGSLFPDLRPDYTRFISESDAVAFYYLSKRNQFIDFSMKNGWKKTKDFDKNVLVYDMGAGTLDITYFTQIKRGGKTHVTISGKMGVSRAGNYLDYVLASIIVKLLCSRIKNETLISELQNLVLTEYTKNYIPSEASKLKGYVRNVLKPMLNKDEDIELQPLTLLNNEMPMSDLTIGDVINHPDYKQFLYDVSDDVFTHFKGLFDSENTRVSPTLVIFSGRTTNLISLRKAVKEGLRNLEIIGDECLFLDLAEGIYSSEVNTTGGNISSLKTAVVDGAMAFCTDFAEGQGDHILHNKNVYAQYGIMFKVGQNWVWEKLIDTHTKPINEETAELDQDGFTIYEYNSSMYDASYIEDLGAVADCTRVRDFGPVLAAYILQSYSCETEKDWIEAKRDMMSVIGYVDLSVTRGEHEYSLTIDKNNEIHFNIGIGGLTLLAHDEYTSPSFVKSMWPIVR